MTDDKLEPTEKKPMQQDPKVAIEVKRLTEKLDKFEAERGIGV